MTSLITIDPLIALTRRNCALARGAENICSEGLPILDCLPRGNLTALTAGILGSLYQIIQRLLCLHKIRFKDSRQVDTSEASGSEPLTQEKDCS